MNRNCLKRKCYAPISRTSKTWDRSTPTSRGQLRLDIHMLNKQSQKDWNQRINSKRSQKISRWSNFRPSWSIRQAQRWTKAISSSKALFSFRRRPMMRRSWVISRVSLLPSSSGRVRMVVGSSRRKSKRPRRATRCHLSRLSVPNTWFHNFNRLHTIRSRNWSPTPIPGR